VLAVTRLTTDEDAIAIADSTPSGLSSYIQAAPRLVALVLARRLGCGAEVRAL
jgi:acyl-CoA reductase-like NAD-dependent aldehyde dehydrogenase